MLESDLLWSITSYIEEIDHKGHGTQPDFQLDQDQEVPLGLLASVPSTILIPYPTSLVADMTSKPRPKTKTTHHDLEKGNQHHSRTTTRPKPKSKASEPDILPHAAEDLTRTELNRHKKKAQKSLRNGDLTVSTRSDS
jgi:hypothetical protein